MKNSSLIGLALLLVGSAAFAQNLRPCGSEKVECTLFDTSNGVYKPIDSDVATFSGLNADEPSIQPESCTLSIVLDNKKGLLYQLNLNDKGYEGVIFIRDKNDMSQTVGDVTSVNMTPDQQVESNYKAESMTCTLRK
jgi:hypothetical protein